MRHLLDQRAAGVAWAPKPDRIPALGICRRRFRSSRNGGLQGANLVISAGIAPPLGSSVILGGCKARPGAPRTGLVEASLGRRAVVAPGCLGPYASTAPAVVTHLRNPQIEGSAQVTRDRGMCRPPGPVRVRPGRREPSRRGAELGARAAWARRLPHSRADSSGHVDAAFACTATADPGATAGSTHLTHDFVSLRLRISHGRGRGRRQWRAPGPCSQRLQREPQPAHHDPGRPLRQR